MWRFEQFFLRSWTIPFYKNKTIPYHLQTFIKHINSKNSLFLTPTDACEIQLHIKNLKMKSNSSPNDIPSKFLKIASCIVSEWLSKFFNKCMTTGEFPDSWKIAHITSIPKVHSPRSSSEYRPISVLPVLSKLFDKVVYYRVYSYLTEHNLIDKRQYGCGEFKTMCWIRWFLWCVDCMTSGTWLQNGRCNSFSCSVFRVMLHLYLSCNSLVN